jgi:ketosteroid isomerase-like protein
MKLFFLILVLSCSLLLAQNTQHINAIRHCLNDQQNAWNRGSIDDFMYHYWNHDSLRFVSGKTISMGWTTALENYKKHYNSPEAMGQLTFTVVYADCPTKKSCILSGTWNITRATPIGGRFTLLWKKIHGQWKIVYDHTS